MTRRQTVAAGAATRVLVVVLAAVLVIVAVVYGRSLGYGFLSWDDDQNVTANRILLEGPWWRFWFAPYQGLYIPPVYTLWSILAALQSPLNPLLFHGVNVLLHLANTLLVLFLARRFMPSGGALAAAAFAALLFALHPLQVETVAWVTGCRDLLCAFWLLLATLLYLRAEGRLWPSAFAWLVFVVALLSKPSAVALPAALLLLDIIACQTPWRKALLRLLPWFALVPPVVIITQQVQAEGVDQALQQLTLWQRSVVALDSFGFYAGKALWPSGLAIDYGHSPQLVLAGQGLAVDLAVLGGVVLTVIFCRGRLRRPGLGWLLWGAALMLPTSGLVVFSYQHTSTVADHYVYVPLVGMAIAAAWLLSGLEGRSRVALGSVLVLAAGVTSSLRLPVWSGDESLYPAMVASKPRSFAGLIGLAAMSLRAKRYEEALGYVNKAQEVEPLNIAALADKGLALARLGRYSELLAELGTKMPDRKLILDYPLSAPDMATLLMTVAFAQIRTGQAKESLPTLCRARFADAANPDVLTFVPMVAEYLGKKADDPDLCEADYRR